MAFALAIPLANPATLSVRIGSSHHRRWDEGEVGQGESVVTRRSGGRSWTYGRGPLSLELVAANWSEGPPVSTAAPKHEWTSTLQQADRGVIRLDADLRVLDACVTARRIMGRRLDELVGSCLVDLVEDGATNLAALCRQLVAGEIGVGVLEVRPLARSAALPRSVLTVSWLPALPSDRPGASGARVVRDRDLAGGARARCTGGRGDQWTDRGAGAGPDPALSAVARTGLRLRRPLLSRAARLPGDRVLRRSGAAHRAGRRSRRDLVADRAVGGQRHLQRRPGDPPAPPRRPDPGLRASDHAASATRSAA